MRSLEAQLADQARDRTEHEALVRESLSFPSRRNWRLFKAGVGCLIAAFVLWKFNPAASDTPWQWTLAAGSFLVIAGLFPMLVTCGLWILAVGVVLSPALVSDGGLLSVTWGYWVVAAILSLLGVAVARSSKLE